MVSRKTLWTATALFTNLVLAQDVQFMGAELVVPENRGSQVFVKEGTNIPRGAKKSSRNRIEDTISKARCFRTSTVFGHTLKAAYKSDM